MIENNTIYIKDKYFYIEYSKSYPGRPTIIFLHDSLGSVKLWRDLPAKISEETQCNILVYDRLGYGKSQAMPTHEREVNYMEQEADILNDLLARLHINNAILFGHSDGGTIALITASKYPDIVKAVICEAGHIFVEDKTLQGVQMALEAYRTTNLGERLEKYHGDKVEMLFRAWTNIWLSERYRSWNIEYLLQNITCPLLFIQGDADEYGTLDQLYKTVSQVRGSTEIDILPNVGHTPHKEVPDLVLDKTAKFIKSL